MDIRIQIYQKEFDDVILNDAYVQTFMPYDFTLQGSVSHLYGLDDTLKNGPNPADTEWKEYRRLLNVVCDGKWQENWTLYNDYRNSVVWHLRDS